MTAASRVAVATSALRKAEQGAVIDKPADSASGGSLYTGSGRSKDSDKKSGFKSKLKKRATYLILSLALGGGLAFLGSSNSLLAPAIEALYTEATDTQYASNSIRFTRIMKYALSGQGSVSTSWSGKMRYGYMSTSFQNRLAKQGIEVIPNGTSKILRYTHTDVDGVTTVKNIDANSFISTYQNDVDFRGSYITAKRGRVASFFDNIANRIYTKLGISRNLFSKFKTSGDADVDMANYRETMSDRFDGNETTTRTVTGDHTTEQDADGNDVNGAVKDSDNSSNNVSSDVDAEAESKASSLLNSILGKVGVISNVGCMIMQVGSMISTIVAANEIYQSINYFMGLTENISKMKAGYGDQSAVNEVLNFFSTPTTTSYTSYSSEYVTASGNCTSQSDIDSCKISLSSEATGQEYGTPLEANGMQMVLAYAPAKQTTNDRYSIERTGNAIARALGTLGVTMVGCRIAKITTSAISIAVSITPAGLAKIASNLMLNIAVGTVINLTASAFLGFLIPTIAKALFTNIFDDATGIPAGELFARGASAANTRLGRSGSSQSPSSKAAALAYNKINQEVLALDAEIDQKNYSPFDITNKNTFFGNLAYNFLLPLSTTSNIISNTSSLARSTSTAIASLIPGAFASNGSDSNYMTTFGECAQLESIGAVGDIYCNPVTTTDSSTINLEPDDENYINAVSPHLDCDDTGCTVKSDSRLDWYIQYCDGRDSPFGILDQNILAAINPVNTNVGHWGVFGEFLPNLPLIGDLMDIAGAVADITNEEWATGAICVNTPENDKWDSEIKYYQRYVEDMRLLEQMGAFEEQQVANTDGAITTIAATTNPVVAAEDRYLAEHPLDSTYAGYLARISGVTKDNVETILALVDLYTYISLYNPDTRVALDEHELTDTTSTELIAKLDHEDIRFKDTNVIKTSPEYAITTKEYIVYADLRSRNYVA